MRITLREHVYKSHLVIETILFKVTAAQKELFIVLSNYCETENTVTTRDISGMFLLCYSNKVSKALENLTTNSNFIMTCQYTIDLSESN